jgi:hypothetical protein
MGSACALEWAVAVAASMAGCPQNLVPHDCSLLVRPGRISSDIPNVVWPCFLGGFARFGRNRAYAIDRAVKIVCGDVVTPADHDSLRVDNSECVCAADSEGFCFDRSGGLIGGLSLEAFFEVGACDFREAHAVIRFDFAQIVQRFFEFWRKYHRYALFLGRHFPHPHSVRRCYSACYYSAPVLLCQRQNSAILGT